MNTADLQAEAPPAAAQTPPQPTATPGAPAKASAGMALPRKASPKARARAKLKAPKATCAAECKTLEQLPNVGPALAADLRLLGIHHPDELSTRDPFVLYQALCAKTGQRHDPCVLDTFMAVTDFMRGAEPAPWWNYTAQRKAVYGQV